MGLTCTPSSLAWRSSFCRTESFDETVVARLEKRDGLVGEGVDVVRVENVFQTCKKVDITVEAA